MACALHHSRLGSAASPELTALGFDRVGQGLAVLIMSGWKELTLEIMETGANATGVALVAGHDDLPLDEAIGPRCAKECDDR